MSQNMWLKDIFAHTCQALRAGAGRQKGSLNPLICAKVLCVTLGYKDVELHPYFSYLLPKCISDIALYSSGLPCEQTPTTVAFSAP